MPPGYRMTDEEAHRYIKLWEKNGRSGSKMAKLHPGTSESTWRYKYKQAVAVISGTPVSKKTAAKQENEAKELNSLRKEVVILRGQLQARSKVPKIPKVKTRTGSDIIRAIIPDTHAQHIDTQAFSAMITDFKSLPIQEIVGLGDHLDCGGFLAQHHTMGYVGQLDESAYADDLAAWEDQLNRITEAAPGAKVTLLEGNHEVRVEKWCVQQTLGNKKDALLLQEALCPEFRLKYKERGITYVKYGEFHKDTTVRGAIQIGRCWFTHGNACGPGAAKKTAEKFGAPVVFGHTHTPATYFGKSVHNGVHASWNFGTLAKFAPRYMHNNPDGWGHGYGLQLVAKSGHFTTIHVPIINGISYLPSALKHA